MCSVDLSARFLEAKRALFDRKFRFLTDRQREAAFTVNGPLLILAGAGSGKTTVLVNRVAFLIRYGNAYYSDSVPEGLTEEDVSLLEQSISLSEDELDSVLAEFAEKPCPPWAVLSITFTNKAANEMRTRLSSVIGEYANDIWAGTFHSVCVRILRQDGERLGYHPGFAIYDTKDSHDLLLKCMNELKLDEKALPVKTVQNEISRAKDRLLFPSDFAQSAGSDFRLRQISSIYTLYQKRLLESNALDFDDLIVMTVRLLRENEDVRRRWQNRFRSVSVDEFQDTNHAQYELVRLFSDGFRNLMVVGDDDQSIYRFRGATVENILHFDRDYPDAKVVKLEQNFRSTKHILEAANAVISKNEERHDKRLWTENPEGEKVRIKRLDNQTEEAKFIINKIMEMVIREKRKYSDFAVLYRVNAQSNVLENVFSRAAIPYRVLAGQKFYDRKEIKDILAYLNVINNPLDSQRLRRIINEPKRKIGESTVVMLEEIASVSDQSIFAIMEDSDLYPALVKTASKLKEFVAMIRDFQTEALNVPVSELVEHVIQRTGYSAMLLSQGSEGLERLENVQELISNAVEYEKTHDEPSLANFLEEISLVADIDNYDKDADAVVMMTIHSAKGLEFPVVFLPGMEEGIFPGIQSATDSRDLEEERRLAYVAFTRAKTRLFCTQARERTLYGRTQYNQPSRFLSDIPEEILDRDDLRRKEESAQRPAKKKPTISAEFTRPAAIAVNVGKTAVTERYEAGDRVVHASFGPGTVLSARAMGSDILYEIVFDEVGTKKIMATYARLKRE